jgi:hypothetical protein
MVRYEHLPLYKTAMDLTMYIETVVRNFSRYHKYTLGTDLRQQSRDLVTVIIRANSQREKLPVLMELREWLEGLLVLVRICKEVRAVSRFEAYAQAAELAVALSRQNEGWIKGQARQRGLGTSQDGQ